MIHSFNSIKRKILCLVVFISVSSLFLNPSQAATKTAKATLTAKAAILVDCDKGKIIFSRNKSLKLECASTSKLLTGLVALEKIGTKAQVRISHNSWDTEPTKAGLTKNAYYSSGDLIAAALIASSNDACVALAEAVAGSEKEFADLMNEKARRLGAVNSNFVTSSGLPAKGQYSNVYDLYLITRAAMQNSFIKAAMKQKIFIIEGSDNRTIKLVNHNKLLFRWSSPLVLGKTGYTKRARHCYAGVAYGKDKQYVIAILGSRKPWNDIQYIISSYAKLKITKAKRK